MTLSIRNLTFQLKRRSLIENISLEFKKGGLYGVLGPNGSGKSTLLKTVSSIWPPTSGEIRWQDVNLQSFSRFDLSKTVTLVPQDPPLFFDSTVLHMVSMGCYGRRSRKSGAPMIVEEALRQVDGLHLQNRMLSELSGGERQRVYIARALATQAPILLLDEPTSYLDLQHQLEIWHLLRLLAGQGKLIIAAVHDFSAAERFCDEIVVLQGGRCKANGPYDHVMTEQILEEVFGVKMHPVTGLYQLVSN